MDRTGGDLAAPSRASAGRSTADEALDADRVLDVGGLTKNASVLGVNSGQTPRFRTSRRDRNHRMTVVKCRSHRLLGWRYVVGATAIVGGPWRLHRDRVNRSRREHSWLFAIEGVVGVGASVAG